MRPLGSLLLSLAIVFVIAGLSFGQVSDCDQIGESPTDSVRVLFSRGAPGDTVNVPIWVANVNGVATFQMYLEFDETYLKPLLIGADTNVVNGEQQILEYYDYLVTGRFLKTKETLVDGESVLDTTTFVQVNSEIDFPGTSPMKRIKILALVDFTFVQDSGYIPTVIVPGSDTIMFVKFVIQPDAPLETTTMVDFWTAELPVYDASDNLLGYECVYSRYADSTGNVDVRFTTVSAGLRVTEQVDLPIINSFTASSYSITAGTQVTLSWNVMNADYITIQPTVGQTSTLIGSATVYPTATTTYTLTAYKGTETATTTLTVTVSGGTNNAPVIQAVAGSPFTINQGETVTFTVTATDADATDLITLKAVILPSNAVFNEVVGISLVTGSCSFTPDFTQSGTFVIGFQATDSRGGASTLMSVVVNVNELKNDRIFSTSAVGLQPVGGLRGKKGVFFPVNMVTGRTVYGIQFDLLYDPVYFEIDSLVTTGRISNWVIYDNIGAVPGEVRIVTFGLLNEPMVNVDDTTAFLYAVFSFDSSVVPGDYEVLIDSGWESTDPDPMIPSKELETDDGILRVDRYGDANLDSYINVGDLVAIVAHVINNFTFNARQFEAADVIFDSVIDVFDLVGVINLIYGIPLSPSPTTYYTDEMATVTLDYAGMTAGSTDVMKVRSELPVDIAGVELEIDYDPTVLMMGVPTLADDASGLALRYTDDGSGRMKVLLHFTNPTNSAELISAGAADLLNIPMTAQKEVNSGDGEQLKLTKAQLATAAAERVPVLGMDNPEPPVPMTFALSQNYPNPFNPTTTIEFSVDVSTRVNLHIYNILGQQVRALVDEYLPAGAYSFEWDATDDNGRKVATGIYLYRLEVDQRTTSKKMLFLK